MRVLSMIVQDLFSVDRAPKKLTSKQETKAKVSYRVGFLFQVETSEKPKLHSLRSQSCVGHHQNDGVGCLDFKRMHVRSHSLASLRLGISVRGLVDF
jgi:hypothetical protein